MSYLSQGLWWLALFPGLALLGVVCIFAHLSSCARSLIDARSAQA